ncbi:MAG: hypothetical protein OQJ99_00115 [Rhodospirillales bacterium]|nr:hypothetical protein [Rhodospirillales bacterium]MCW8861177.1 hypothetical protein [Rhodospirillales bacterium]MCW8951160.1 hypothetical protein [Rhodospirillales bacterium]MCW8970962.1 hypothetical protein [Rhodospirillales bacterium]MCW9002648.1 hypothetical protein [Rhodospirillales bacterium]
MPHTMHHVMGFEPSALRRNCEEAGIVIGKFKRAGDGLRKFLIAAHGGQLLLPQVQEPLCKCIDFRRFRHVRTISSTPTISPQIVF